MPQTTNDLTFGIELEVFLPVGKTHADLAIHMTAGGIATRAEVYGHNAPMTWKIVTDGSLGDYARGAEAVSPILKGADGLAMARKAANLLESFGCTVNKETGFHVHVGVPAIQRRWWYGSDEEQVEPLNFVKRVVGIWAKHEATIDGLVSPSRRTNTYCKMVGQPAAAFKNAKKLDTLERAYYRRDRYRKVNVMACRLHGTVEFRQHQGTTDGDKVVNWVRLCLAICAKATEPETAAPRTRRGAGRAITILERNPHAYGSTAYRVFETYRDGMTVEEISLAAEHIVAARSNAMLTSRDPRRAVAAYYVNPDARRGAIRIGAEVETQTQTQNADPLAALVTEIGADAELAGWLAARQARFA